MAFRPLIISVSVWLALLMALPAAACFGPKLFLGVEKGAERQVLAAFVAIYVKETTGTDVERVPLDDRDPGAEIIAEQIDFAFADEPAADTVLLMQIEALPILIGGPRIDNDLQFTTVRPTLERLAEKLSVDDVAALSGRVAAGELAMDVVRTFLIDRRWI